MLVRIISAGCLSMSLCVPVFAEDHRASVTAEQDLLLSGSVDLSAGNVFMQTHAESDKDYPNNTGRISGEARVNLPFFSNASLQLDVTGEADFNNDYGDDDSIDDYENQILGGAHLNYRSPEHYLLGIWGSVGEAQILNQDSETGWMGGIEAQYYFGNTTLYGQAGLFASSARDKHSETLEKAQFGRAVVRHFIDPNMSVSAEFLYGRGDDGADDTKFIDFASWSLEGEKRFADSPVSFSVSYEGNYIGNSRNTDVSDEKSERLIEHVFMAGISFKFGSTTLLQEDRYGATLDIPLAPLRAAVYSADIVD